MTGDVDGRASARHPADPPFAPPVTRDALLQAMVDRVVQELQAERGTLYLLDAASGTLNSRVAHLPELDEIRLPLGQGVAGRVAQTGTAALLCDVHDDTLFYPGIDARTGFTTRSMIAVPLKNADGAILGVLQVLNRRVGSFSATDQQTLLTLAGQVVQALSRASSDTGGEHGAPNGGPLREIVGDSPGMRELYSRTLCAATTDATVLIRGESGTGKTLVARAIHANSDRRHGPLVHVDCAALPASLIESELFGHERGAFTGADRRVQGKFELAQGGTLFLDEIGDLPPLAQGKLLRFLQEREFERLGGRETLRADVRVISATNVDLEAQLANGRFRRDLYYRIRVLELQVLPLRERGATDLRRLAQHFVERFARRYRRPTRVIGAAALAALEAHDWPGNVRELEHCIQSAVILCQREALGPRHLSLAGRSAPPAADAGYPPTMPLAEVIRDHLRRAVAHCDGNRTEAARLLGIGRNTLVRRLSGGTAAAGETATDHEGRRGR